MRIRYGPGSFVGRLFAAILAAGVCSVVAQPQANLESGKPLERPLSGAEVHRYRLTLQTGQLAKVRVEQRGIDVAVQLLGDDNGLIAAADDEIGDQGTEKLDIVADHDGAYTIQIKPKLKLARGDYEIRVTEIRPAAGADHYMFEVLQLRTQAHHLLDVDQTLKALPLTQRALELAQQTLGPDDAYVGLLTRDLAEVIYNNGKPAEAKPQFERALQILTAKLGADDPQAVLTKTRLGSVNIVQGDLSQADLQLSQALESAERTLGKDSLLVAVILKTIGILYGERHDTTKAEASDLRALAIVENLGATEQKVYGELLNNLGVLYANQREFDKAQSYYERALAFHEEHYGPSPALSKLLNNLGVVARQRKDYAAAEKYYLRALDLKERFLGPKHPEYAAVLMNLANVYASEGDYRKALDTHLRSLNIFEIGLTPGEFPPIFALANVAKDYAVLGDFENANRVQARLEAAIEEDIAFNLAIGSDRQKLAYLNFVAERTDRTVSLNLQLEPGNPRAAAMAATALLQRKGRGLDATADTLGALRKHAQPGDQVLLDQLKEATTQLAHLALRGPHKQTLEEYGKALQALREQKEKLENTIAHHNEEFRAQSQPVTLEAVSSAIPADAGLVEFVVYRPFNLKAQTDAEQYGEPRYAAYIFHLHGPPLGVDLGPAPAIDAAVRNLREALRDPARSEVRQLAQALAELVFQPLQPLVSGDSRLLISPDGQLDLIPFEALLDDRGRYLLERFPITYLTTGRDLLRMQVPRGSQSAPMIVADPFFGEPEGTLLASTGRPSIDAKTARRSVTTGADFSTLYFAPLSGTRSEAMSIAALFPGTRVLVGKQASESTVEELKAPSILHIATHGFFLENTKRKAGSGSKGENKMDNADPESPLLRSGLALSGANLVKDGKGDGILTALEAANLDLWGTKLVTLSACDTGVGEIRNGEGVYGLRRSFVLAGAETLVMSLWPVSDYVTREMMTSYYTGLKNDLGRGEALRQAELAMMKRKGREHPFYWASFIQSGEWANLDGQR